MGDYQKMQHLLPVLILFNLVYQKDIATDSKQSSRGWKLLIFSLILFFHIFMQIKKYYLVFFNLQINLFCNNSIEFQNR